MKGVISSSYTDELWAIYENIMTGSRFVLKFSFLHNFVNFVCTDMYDTSKYSRVQGLSFAYLHLRHLITSWGRYDLRYDLKTEKRQPLC